MKTTARNFKQRSQSGQSLVEVALLTPLLIALLLGAIEFGRYAYLAILVGNAARAGAAYATEHLANAGNTPGITLAADNDYKNNGQDPTKLTVSSGAACGCDNGTYPIATATCYPGSGTVPPSCSAGSHWVVGVTVTASGTYKPLFNYPWIPSSLTVTRQATMRSALR